MENADTILDQIRAKIGPPPRKTGWFKPSPWDIPEPDWMKTAPLEDEPMKEIVSGLKSLWKHGVIVWGHLVRANTGLYTSGEDDCPGTVIFSPTASDGDAYKTLPGLAEKLHQLRASIFPVEEWSVRESEWREDLQNDMSYHRGFKLPETWQLGSQDYKGSNVLFHRRHLPDGFIQSRFLPMLVHPITSIAQVVPAEVWPAELKENLAGDNGFADD